MFFLLSLCFAIIGVAFMPTLLPLLAWCLVCLCAAWLFFYAKPFAWMLLGLGLGGGYATWVGEQALATRWHAPVQSHVQLSGWVEGLPKQNERRVQFVLRTHQIHFSDAAIDMASQTLPKRVLVSWYDADAMPKPGTYWQYTVRLKPPRAVFNPAGFDAERYWFYLGVDALATVHKHVAQPLPEYNAAYSLSAWRFTLRQRLQEKAGHHELFGPLLALTLGDKSGLTAEHWRVLKANGLQHLLAISGMHLSLVAVLLVWLMRRMTWGLSFLWPGCLHQKKWICLLAWLGVTIYALLAGWHIATQRAWVMVSLGLLAWAFEQQVLSLSLWVVALAAVLLWHPLAPLSMGFWLSFSAVFWLSLLRIRLGRERQPNLWHMQWLLSLGLWPLVGLVFAEVAVTGVLVNLLIIPIFGVLVMPWVLLCEGLIIFGVNFDVVFDGLLWLLALFGFALTTLSDYAWMWHWPPWGVLGSCLCLLMLAWWLIPSLYWARGLSVPMLLALFWPPTALPIGSVRVQVLDVGQGLSVLVQTRHHALLYDAGPAYLASDAGERIVLPMLRRARINHLHALMVSHADLDHRGGSESVLRAYPDAVFWHNDHSLPNVDRLCRAGEQWQWDGVTFEVLHPHEQQSFTSRNNRSCVLRIYNGAFALLLPGDIEWQAEWQLLGEPIQADVVVVPHHGSLTSSSEDWVSATQAQYAISSVSANNRWGFPKKIVENRWLATGAMHIATDETGTWSFTADNQTGMLNAHSARHRYARYWRLRPKTNE